jgi:hypothetical protein
MKMILAISIRRFILIVFMIQVFALTCSSQDTIDLNLYKLTLNNIIIKDLTVDKLTKIFGRPSSEQDLHFATGIYYNDKGLAFLCNEETEDSQQKIQCVTVYLIRTWDNMSKTWFSQFQGEITPKLDSSMKAGIILQLFKDYPISSLSDPAHNMESAVIHHGTIKIFVSYEKASKFLNEVTVNLNPL